MKKNKNVLVTADCVVEIPFHDVDAANVAWHGHYAKYFEIARCKLLDKIDYNYREMESSGFFWPVIDMHIRYISPAYFGQRVVVTANLVEWEHRLRVEYLVTDAQAGTKLTKGHTEQVAVRIETGEMQLASPDVLFRKLGLEEAE